MGIPASNDWSAIVERFSGFAADYDAHRPAPPALVTKVLSSLARRERIGLVVDLGCGTVRSSRLWADRAEQIIGIDPSADMLAQAVRSTPQANIAWRQAFSHDTGIPDHCADIVVCGESLHWMDPAGTAREVERILRPGGVFGSYWYRFPPTTPYWEIDVAYQTLMARIKELESAMGIAEKVWRWPSRAQENALASCGAFRFTKEIFFHQEESGDADRLVRTIKTLGAVMTPLKRGMTEEQAGFTQFQDIVNRAFAGRSESWYFTCGLWMAVT
jgi:ubiquinone/menaquinone biosynthesis C-methylase UbiE